MGRVMPRNVARRALAVTRQALAVALLIGAAVWPWRAADRRGGLADRASGTKIARTRVAAEKNFFTPLRG